MGPLNNKSQYDYVNGLINRANESGANIITGGIQLDPESWEQGYFIMPTIITGVNNRVKSFVPNNLARLFRSYRFQDIDKVVQFANDSEFGLRASVWTENEALAVEVGRRLEGEPSSIIIIRFSRISILIFPA